MGYGPFCMPTLKGEARRHGFAETEASSPMHVSNPGAHLPAGRGVRSIRRTAVYGPVRMVVREGEAARPTLSRFLVRKGGARAGNLARQHKAKDAAERLVGRRGTTQNWGIFRPILAAAAAPTVGRGQRYACLTSADRRAKTSEAVFQHRVSSAHSEQRSTFVVRGERR
jgi:hypothetical protein